MPHERPALPSRPLSPLPIANSPKADSSLPLRSLCPCVSDLPFLKDRKPLVTEGTEKAFEKDAEKTAGTARPGVNRDELALGSLPGPPSGLSEN
jgi:hypothetical protein